MSRRFTNRLLTLVDNGVFDARTVLQDALNYMSEADVEDMCDTQGYIEDPEEDPEEDAAWNAHMAELAQILHKRGEDEDE